MYMKVDAIQNHSNIRSVHNNYGIVYPKNYFNQCFSSDVFTKSKEVSFCATAKVKSNSDELSYEKFMAKYREVYGDRPMNEVISDVIQNNEELGHGIEKKVYVFPKMEEYLIAHLYQQPHIEQDLPIEKCNIKYPRYNFAQPIAQNNYDIIIMKRIPGVSNSVNDAYQVTDYICKNDCVTKEMSQEYLSKLRLFKDFPQEAYNHLAQQFKYLQDNGAFVDIINCNNLLIDTDNQEFHLIDLPPDLYNEIAKMMSNKLGGVKQGAYEMIALLLDPRFQYYCLERMSPQEQQETINISKNVIKKCFIASNELSLPANPDLVGEFYRYIQSVNPTWGERFNHRYSEFLKLYNLQTAE